MDRPCAVCGGPVAAKPRGRPSVYCSRACQAKAYRARKTGQPVPAPAARGDISIADRVAAEIVEATMQAAAHLNAGRPDRAGPLHAYALDRLAVLGAIARTDARRQVDDDRPGDETPAAVTETGTPAPAPPVRDENKSCDEIPAESFLDRLDRQRQERAVALAGGRVYVDGLPGWHLARTTDPARWHLADPAGNLVGTLIREDVGRTRPEWQAAAGDPARTTIGQAPVTPEHDHPDRGTDDTLWRTRTAAARAIATWIDT